MAYYEVHCADCRRELGDDFSEVNLWLDDYFKQFGPDHRVIRHHDLAIEKVKEKWGEMSAKAAEIHIRKDYYGDIPKFEDEIAYIIRSSMFVKLFKIISEEYKGNERLEAMLKKYRKQ